MNVDHPPHSDRLEELLIDRALQGLSPAEEAELHSLKQHCPNVDLEAMDRCVALLDEGLFPPSESLPPELERRLLQDAPQHLPVIFSAQKRTSRSTSWAYGGWAIAACLALAVGWLLFTRPASRQGFDPQPTERSLAEKRAELETLPSTQRYTVAQADAGQAGTILWNAEQQAGVLELQGFPPNNAQQARYQLWIVDGARTDPKHAQPVDGGLFDVNPDGTALVPIRAALPVGLAQAFAITKEVPTGVVVSEGPHLMVLVAAK